MDASVSNVNAHRASRCIANVLGACALIALLAGCGGSTGAEGPAGPSGGTGPQGPPGPSGPVTAIDVSTAQTITATISSVTIPAAPTAAQPVVEFALVNEVGVPLSGLQASQLGFAVARLVPPGTQLAAVPPQTTAPAPQTSSQWQSYLYISANPVAPTTPPALPVVGTTPQPQASVESGATGKFVDNRDGTYQYTFAKDISKDAAIPYDATLTHRVALEIRGLAAANSPVYTFQPSSGATTNIATNDVVSDQTCKSCHNELAFHGGARTATQYCVMCHNPSSIDPSSGNSLDFKVMFHKIHMGENLPSVAAGGHYYLFGYRGAIANYSEVAYPQTDASANNAAVSGSGQRFCATCHNESDALAPQAAHFKSVINSQACGSCHDNVNFTTGVGHSAANIVSSDSDCVTCHGPASTIGNGALQVVAAHRTPVDTAAAKFKYTVVSATNTAPGQTPVVTIKVTDPTNGDAPYNIQQAGGPFQFGTSSLRVNVAWDALDFNNIGTNSATGPTAGTPNQPVVINFVTGATANSDGTFTKAAAIPIPAGATGSGNMLLEGRAVVTLPNKSGSGTTDTQLGVPGAGLIFAITDSTPKARRQIVDIGKCNSCHRTLTLHGENRTDNIELCASCHNPNTTDIGRRAAASGACAVGTPDSTIDFKRMIHQIHASGANNNPITVCGFGNSANTFNVGYPGALNDCVACHNADTYYPVDPTVVQGTSVHAGADRTALTDDVVFSPNAAVCSSCHIDNTAIQHMTQNGGDFNATKTAAGKLVSAGTETCALCHGPGRVSDVKVAHRVASFK